MKIIGLSAAAAALPKAVSAQASPDKPNILFIMSDDHCYQAIGAYGSRLARLNPTPTIDTLAKEGIRLDNCFCTNSICTPSRACIMTGQYSAVNGVYDLGGRLQPEHQYLAIEMKKAGYQTAVIGKWHLKTDPNFDYYKVLPGQGSYMNPTFKEKGKGRVKMQGHSSDCITDSVLAYLKKRDRTRPFFLKYHFKAPHDMFQNAPRYESYLADVEIPEPDSLWDNRNNGSIATRGHKDELVRYIGTSIGRRNIRRNYTKNWAKELALNDDEAKRQAYQTYLKKFLRCVKGVDDNLKRVIDYLKLEGIYDNTVIMYTGDQGFMLGEHDYQDKRWAYEESMRMPFIVRYPKTIKAGTRTDAIVENVDFGPTMLDFAGVATPKYMQGRSFKSILETGREPRDAKQAAYYHYWMHMAHHDNPAHIAIRTKRYKLIMFYGTRQNKSTPETPPGWELYNVKRDPHEMNNLYDDPAYKDTIAQLKQQLKALRSRYKEDNPKFPFNRVIDEFWNYDEADRLKVIEISHAYRKSRDRSRQQQESRKRSRTKR
jgi:N-acetylglucosamine-6-sulfatase